jgi:hypothetical protein
MADDKSKRSAQDRAQVNVNEDYEVEYLAQKLGVMPEEIRTAEAKVGKSRSKIEEHFRDKLRK